MKTIISFSDAVDGYFLAAGARHLSQHTLADYAYTFRKFGAFLGTNPNIKEITAHDVESFLRCNTVSKKTLLNYLIGLSSLWHWAANERLVQENIISKIPKPKPEQTVIVELSLLDIKSLLANVDHSKSFRYPGRPLTSRALPVADRNRAIILLLLDTGLRASELCSLKIADVDLRNYHFKVIGKGSKERLIPFSPRTGQAIWKYLASRKDSRPKDALFTTSHGRALDRTQLSKQLQHIAVRAGVLNVHPHRFRHTFAINYLRNGGDIFSLQMILGHSTLEMERRYLALAQADVDNGHRRASPVDNWRL